MSTASSAGAGNIKSAREQMNTNTLHKERTRREKFDKTVIDLLHKTNLLTDGYWCPRNVRVKEITECSVVFSLYEVDPFPKPETIDVPFKDLIPES